MIMVDNHHHHISELLIKRVLCEGGGLPVQLRLPWRRGELHHHLDNNLHLNLLLHLDHHLYHHLDHHLDHPDHLDHHNHFHHIHCPGGGVTFNFTFVIIFI